jgi:hypothetical protein
MCGNEYIVCAVFGLACIHIVALSQSTNRRAPFVPIYIEFDDLK